ncbi:MAG: hypothetical protein N4A40_12960 [Tissierellales bacterium]|jgi:hypothetical protein|nr:hypothetical protein [Tissierellales bacterium]
MKEEHIFVLCLLTIMRTFQFLEKHPEQLKEISSMTILFLDKKNKSSEPVSIELLLIILILILLLSQH